MRQIEIIEPMIIMPLGELALIQVERYYDLKLEGKSLTEKISKLGSGVIEQNGAVIIPNFHPASHVDPSIMLDRWKLLWEYLVYP
ncbi:hypothetical protein H6763_02055 [Candidatus Nomurabacteria bacterium]|nr:hypothetical protein [Candidatus Nomurabacteria bacterium]